MISYFFSRGEPENISAQVLSPMRGWITYYLWKALKQKKKSVFVTFNCFDYSSLLGETNHLFSAENAKKDKKEHFSQTALAGSTC